MDKKLCYSCMKMIDEDSVFCEHCGFNVKDYSVSPRCLPLGTKLGTKYIVGKVLGEGGFGITYIGYDTVLEMRVAIKEYFPPQVASRDVTGGSVDIHMFSDRDKDNFEEGINRCVKEARNMSKLDAFDGIVTIRDFFIENNTAYIIMEYVDGKTLKDHMKSVGKMAPKDVLEVMKPVMESLNLIHKQGIIHRDISPDNIMIRKDGKVKLIDFGAARVTQDDNGKSFTVMLKRGFDPEEQYRTNGDQGPWTDIYALCATLYYMLTGKVPVEAMSRLVKDENVLLADYGLDIEPKIAKAIDKGLSVYAGDRQKSMAELIYDIYGEVEKIPTIVPVASDVNTVDIRNQSEETDIQKKSEQEEKTHKESDEIEIATSLEKKEKVEELDNLETVTFLEEKEKTEKLDDVEPVTALEEKEKAEELDDLETVTFLECGTANFYFLRLQVYRKLNSAII